MHCPLQCWAWGTALSDISSATISGADGSSSGENVTQGGDLDGDGVVDLVVPDSGPDDVYVFLGPFAGTRSIADADAVITGELDDRVNACRSATPRETDCRTSPSRPRTVITAPPSGARSTLLTRRNPRGPRLRIGPSCRGVACPIRPRPPPGPSPPRLLSLAPFGVGPPHFVAHVVHRKEPPDRRAFGVPARDRSGVGRALLGPGSRRALAALGVAPPAGTRVPAPERGRPEHPDLAVPERADEHLPVPVDGDVAGASQATVTGGAVTAEVLVGVGAPPPGSRSRGGGPPRGESGRNTRGGHRCTPRAP